MSTQIQSVRELATRVARDPQLAEELKEDPAGTLSRIAAPIPNTTVYRIVVSALGLAVLIALIGSIILVLKDKTNLEVLTALGSAAVGALAGLLAPSPTNS
jgi:hypothetical protein